MYAVISVHYPKPEKEGRLIDSMHRFSKAMKGRKGLKKAYTLRDEETGRIVGIALFDKKKHWLAARPYAQKAVEDDPIEEWEEKPLEGFSLEEV